MSFKISVITGRPVYDSLPAVKIGNYRNPVPEDYRPFAQGRLAFGGEGFYLQLIAFEVTVSKQSRLGAEFSAGAGVGGEKYFSLAINETGLEGFSLWESGRLLWRDDSAAESIPIHGEDLQGEYWGGQALVPYETLARIWPEADFAAGSRLWGNLYKYSDDPEWKHWGSFYPSCGMGRDFGEFELVSY